MLKGLVEELRRNGLAVAFASVHAPVLERARETGLFGAAGEGMVFATVDLAVRALEERASPPGEAHPGGVLP